VLQAIRSATLAPLLGLVALLISSAPAAAQANSPEYGIRPALSGRTTLSKNHFAYSVPQGGATVHDAVVVANYTDSPITFDVHGADMLAAQGGGLAPAAEGATPTLVGAWLAVEHSPVVVPPHGEVTDGFTLSVPAGEKPGEHLGAVVVVRRPNATSGIRVVTRAALTVDVTVVGDLVLRAVADPLLGTQKGSDEHFALTVANPGNVFFTVSGDVTVRDGSGRVLATIPLSPPGIYVIPGGHADLTAVWRGVPWWWGSAVATATVSAQPASGRSATFRSSPLHLGFFNWALVAGPIAGIAGGMSAHALITRRRRRRA
jgi:hypothetical protein